MDSESKKGATFVALSEKQIEIAALYEHLGNWLSRFNRYQQLADNFYREEDHLVQTANSLISDVRVLIDKPANYNKKDENQPMPRNEEAQSDLMNTETNGDEEESNESKSSKASS